MLNVFYLKPRKVSNVTEIKETRFCKMQALRQLCFAPLLEPFESEAHLDYSHTKMPSYYFYSNGVSFYGHCKQIPTSATFKICNSIERLYKQAPGFGHS